MTDERYKGSLPAYQKKVFERPFAVSLTSDYHIQFDYPEGLTLRADSGHFAPADSWPTICDHRCVAQVA